MRSAGDLGDANPEQEMMFWGTTEIREIQGFWYFSNLIDTTNNFWANFQPRRDDVVILASAQKTGTTWLKALSHSILFRDYDDKEDLLTKLNPQICVPSDIQVYSHNPSYSLTHIDERRLFHTHVPYSHLPQAIQIYSNGLKLVYITREPKDTLVSQWHFFNKVLTNESNPFPLEKAVDSFCSGAMPFGPYWDHVLEYWEESKKSPDKVMFIKYEDLHRDTSLHVRKLASFLGRPFGDSEEGEVEKVIWRSSFDRLKDLEVNKRAPGVEFKMASSLNYSYFFRRGQVGDWRNYLTLGMAQRVDRITKVKFRGTGLYVGDDGNVVNV